MSVIIRVHRTVYGQALDDLKRRHPFAHERVGFFASRVESLGDSRALVLLVTYRPIPDRQYIPDPLVGARINSAAIHDVMQQILDTGEGAFHVHLHGDKYPLGFSKPDIEGYRRLLPSLRATAKQQAHGAIVLNSTGAEALVWLPGQEVPVPAEKLTIVGFPLEVWRKSQ